MNESTNERDKIKVITPEGTERVGELLMDIRLESTGKNYVLYTFHEVDERNLETIYASTVEIRNGSKVFTDIATDEEWTQIKQIMKETIQKNSQVNG